MRVRLGRVSAGTTQVALLETLEERQFLSLGTLSLVEGPSTGSDSNVVAFVGAWSASSNASWLHTSSSGTGNGLAKFTFDANAGDTRAGTLTIAGQTLTVTQAGAGYVAANPVTTLVSTGLSFPGGVAVDGSGNVYIADTSNNAVKEWNASTQAVTTLVSSGLSNPAGVAVDGAGNVYIADWGHLAIKEWNASTHAVTTLVSSGLNFPNGVAVDGAGNVYIADTGHNEIEEWNASTHAVTTLVSTGLYNPEGVAVDGAGNVYIADATNNAIKKWNASTQAVTALVSSGLNTPYGVAVDGEGNVYIADRGNNAIKEWNASTQTVTTPVSSGLNQPCGVAVDPSGNVYIADTNNNTIKELSRAFVPVGAVNEPAQAGSYPLQPVLPATESLAGIFAPTSDQSWLTIGGVSGGVVNFSLAGNNTGAVRTAHMTVLGQQIAVTQAAAFGTAAMLEGPASGSDTDIVAFAGAWTASSNASWLHTSSSGTGNGLATFTFDTNAGDTRAGTLTIAGQTLTVTQAGANYAAANPVTTLVSTGLNNSHDVAVDGAGNVYSDNNLTSVIVEWNASTQTVSNPVSSGLSHPYGVAADGAGNLYFVDGVNNAIKQWNASTQALTTLVSSGLSNPARVAVDVWGNVYIADTFNNAIKEWNASTQAVTTLISSGLNAPYGLAVDGAGNVYIADTSNNAIKKWNASTQAVTTLVSSGLSSPYGVAVDSEGNVYIADRLNNAIKEWKASTQAVTTLVSSGLNGPCGVAVDQLGNVYIADSSNNSIKELSRAFVPGGTVNESAQAGSYPLPPVLPATESLAGIFAPISNQSWLTIDGVSGGVVSFSLAANGPGAARTAQITILGRQIAVTQAQEPPLGANSLLEGPASGSDSDVVPFTSAWTASSNASWLHTSSSGTGNGLATFTFDANVGPARTGTLTIAGQTLTVTQAGAGYAAAGKVTLVSSGLSYPGGIAADGSGNVYIADTYNKAIKEWNASTQAVTTLVSSGLNNPSGVAVDGAGNVYIADTYNSAIKEWNASTQAVTTLVSSGLQNPYGLAVDFWGNVYIADTTNNAIKEWNASTQTVTTLVSSGLSSPYGVAVDGAGNVYIADSENSAIKEWNASTQAVTTLVSSGLYAPYGVAVDGAGNVYIADTSHSAIKEWSAATHVVTTLSSGLNYPWGVAVDNSGNIYIDDTNNNSIKKLSRTFVPGGTVNEPAQAGSYQLPAVLPATQPLTGVFAPTKDQSWLTIGGVSGGVVNFSLAANNNGAVRTAHITVLGRAITVTQGLPLGTAALLEGPASGSDSDLVVSFTGAWTAGSNASWLHTSSSGTGNGLATFTFDANVGAARTGTLTIAGQTLTVTQAPAGYVSAGTVPLVSTGLNGPYGVAVDGSGNVYMADKSNNTVKKWNASTQAVTTLVSSGLSYPTGVAVDGAGNVYIADTLNNAIKEWNASTQTVTTLVSSGLYDPEGVAVDGAGNVYISDTMNFAIKEWNASTQAVTTLVSSGLRSPVGVAVDGAGNVYIADTMNNAIKEWNASTHAVTTLVSSGLNEPYGVAVDNSGNVCIADTYNAAIMEWSASTHAVTTLISDLNSFGVAVDNSGNLYIADSNVSSIKKILRAFVPGGTVNEYGPACSDQLPPVLPTTAPQTGVFAPSSDQSWLTIGGVSSGVVNFSLPRNESGAARTAHITVLGQAITVNQAALGDVNADGVVNAADIDAVYQHFDAAAISQWKVDGDATVVGQADVDYVVKNILHKSYGDANLDGKVDFADFQVLLDHWQLSGQGWANGDFTGGGMCDFADFQRLLDNWNPTGLASANEEASNAASSPGTIAGGSAVSGDVPQTAEASMPVSAAPTITGPLSSGSLIQPGATLTPARSDVNSPSIQVADLLASAQQSNASVYVPTAKAAALSHRSSLVNASWTLDGDKVDLLTQLIKPVMA